MSSTTMTSVSSTVISVGGTPTIFLPLPTPYPSEEGCGTNVYQLTSTAPTFLAWDPVYGQSVTDATSCFPPQVTTWWLQSSSALIYTALGPSFACPEAYSTVSTNYVASSVQEVYCCPTYVPSRSSLRNSAERNQLTAQFIHSPIRPAKPGRGLSFTMHINAYGRPDAIMVHRRDL